MIPCVLPLDLSGLSFFFLLGSHSCLPACLPACLHKHDRGDNGRRLPRLSRWDGRRRICPTVSVVFCLANGHGKVVLDVLERRRGVGTLC